MQLLKRTYALPPGTLEEFEQVVAPGRRSQVIAQVLHDWLERIKQEQLRTEVIEGCRAMADVYLEVEAEFYSLEEEVARGGDSRAKTRRHRPSTSRSKRRG